MPQPFGPSQLRGCGTVVSSPLVEPLGSPSVRPCPSPQLPIASESLKHRFRSFKTIQCFNQDSNQILALSGSTEFSVVLWYLYHFFLLQLCFHFIEARPRIRFVIHKSFLPRKEVIQPHLPIRLPCYDFTPVIGLTFDGCAPKVHSPASGAPNSHGVTGGVYKARERIHRGMLIRDY